MLSLNRLVPLLAALAPLQQCSSFAPSTPCLASPRCSRDVLRSSPSDVNESNSDAFDLERAGRAAGSALLGLALGLAAVSPLPDAAPFSGAANALDAPSIALSSARNGAPAKSEDDIVLRELEKETREVEREARIDARKARAERGRKAFFDYDAQMAEQTEARIEAAEQKFLAEEEKDKELAEELMREEKEAEREAALASTKEEKLAKQKEAKALLKKEREIERKEKKAERMERVYLAEETKEKEILAQKLARENAEDQKYDAVEKEYETVAELAKEDEEELSLLKSLSKRK